MIGHEEKKGAGPLSLEICPLPEEPWMDGFQMGVVTIETRITTLAELMIIKYITLLEARSLN